MQICQKGSPLTARALWVLAVNQHGGYGRWVFIEIADPWDAENLIRAQTKQNKT